MNGIDKSLDPASAPPSFEELGLTRKEGIKEKNLGQDEFLSLMIAQMSNQDPMKPMENGEFISQMAQFNSLNELMSLNKTMDGLMSAQLVTQGSAMIGKTITANLSTGETVKGIVSAMQIRDRKSVV